VKYQTSQTDCVGEMPCYLMLKQVERIVNTVQYKVGTRVRHMVPELLKFCEQYSNSLRKSITYVQTL
jgi:hypothetical protein